MSVLQVVPGLRLAAPRDGARLRELLNEAVEVDDAPTVRSLPQGSAAGRHPGRGQGRRRRRARAQGRSRTCWWSRSARWPSVAVDVADLLDAQGIGVTVVDPRWVKPVDPAIVELAREHRLVVSVEDNGRVGGCGAVLLQTLNDAGVTTPMRMHGIPQEFLGHAKRAAILERIGLTPQALARGIIEDVAAPRPAAERHRRRCRPPRLSGAAPAALPAALLAAVRSLGCSRRPGRLLATSPRPAVEPRSPAPSAGRRRASGRGDPAATSVAAVHAAARPARGRLLAGDRGRLRPRVGAVGRRASRPSRRRTSTTCASCRSRELTSSSTAAAWSASGDDYWGVVEVALQLDGYDARRSSPATATGSRRRPKAGRFAAQLGDRRGLGGRPTRSSRSRGTPDRSRCGRESACWAIFDEASVARRGAAGALGRAGDRRRAARRALRVVAVGRGLRAVRHRRSSTLDRGPARRGPRAPRRRGVPGGGRPRRRRGRRDPVRAEPADARPARGSSATGWCGTSSTHVAIGEHDDHAPIWLSEGLAECVSVRPLAPEDRAVSDAPIAAAGAGGRPSCRTTRRSTTRTSALHYGVSWWACEYLAPTFGQPTPVDDPRRSSTRRGRRRRTRRAARG